VKSALHDQENGWVVEASRKIWEREQLGSTFFNEGVAFPHARLDGLTAPRIALGLTRHGIVDVIAKQPIEVVFLILSPVESPTAQLQMLALTSRAAQDRHFLQQLQMAKSSESAVAMISDWERTQ
jgi:mannitol/fructose-specific phosphotransferase system IIA component (Ntr-type)